MTPNTSDAPVGAQPERDDKPAYWSGVFAMSLCVFALVASEFMPVSLLTPIAGDLRITEGMAGQGIAISGAFAVLTSVSISALAGTMDRKKLLLMMTVLMGISGAIVALAPNHLTYMAGRALIGVVIGGFWSMSVAMAIRLVPSNQVPKALAIFNGGNVLATVIAAPLGSYLGAIIGWRGAFFALVPVALIALAWQWRALPAMKSDARKPGSGNVFKVLKSRTVAYGMAGCGAFFMGQFALFTYLRPFLETVTHVEVSTLLLLLLVIGVAGFVGTLVIGSILKRSLYGPLMLIPTLMAVIAIALIPFGGWVVPVAVLLGLWGLMATATPVGWWTWVAKAMPHDAEAGGGLMVAVVQFSIALGSTVGGPLFDGSGYQSTFIASAVMLLIAAFDLSDLARASATRRENLIQVARRTSWIAQTLPMADSAKHAPCWAHQAAFKPGIDASCEGLASHCLCLQCTARTSPMRPPLERRRLRFKPPKVRRSHACG